MPQPVKYSTSSVPNAIKKGNMAIGVNQVEYSPTSTTGWYAGISPPVSGYTVYVNKATQGPSILVASNDNDLVSVARSQGASASVTTAAGALNYFASQSDMMVVNKNYNDIVTSGLVLNVDASFVASYPVSGTSWYDISGSGNNGTLVNGPTFNSSNGGSIVFDGVNNYYTIPQPGITISPNQWTISLWVNPGNKSSRFLTPQSNGIDQYLTYDTVNQRVQISVATSGDTNERTRSMSSNTVLRDNWTFLTISLDNLTIKMYSNGVLRNTFTETLSIGNWSGSWVVGQRGNATFYYLGKMSNLMVHNRVLTDDEILQNYYGGPIVTSGLTFAVDAGNLVSFQNGSGSTFSLVGSYTGTLENGVSYTIGNGGGWVFDGVDDYVNVSNGSFGYSPGTTGELSLEVWINPTGPFTSYIVAPPTTNLAGVFGQGYFNATVGWGLGIVVITGVGNCFSFQVRNVSNIVSVGSNLASGYATFTTNQWYHLVGTFTRNDFSRLYVNGILKSSSSSVSLNNVSITPSLTDAALSRAGSTGQFYTGCNIGIARLYTRALSASEVVQNFNAQKRRFGF